MIKAFKKPAWATIIKVLIGGYFMVTGIMDKQWQVAVLGILMVIFSLFVKIPCDGSCSVNIKQKK